MSPDQWRDKLLACSARETPEQQASFLRLVDMVYGSVTPDVAQVLVATFTIKADVGTQERVCSILAGAPVDTRVAAILDELPRLMREAPIWADTLMGSLVRHDLMALKRHLHFASVETRQAVRALLARNEFRDLNPEARSLQAYCD